MNWNNWLNRPAGNYLLTWEQAQYDRLVPDLFGYQALQLGLPQLLGLRENRITKRGLIVDTAIIADKTSGITHLASFDMLPFASESIDLVLLPHTLELAATPYTILCEVERILRPEGHILLSGFNPRSLWGMQHSLSRIFGHGWLPNGTQPIAYSQIRDWLKGLSFEIDGGRFGCYRLASQHEKWLRYSSFMEKAGDRWWPIFGASYMLSAVKRSSGMHLIGTSWKQPRPRSRGLAPASNSSANLPHKRG